MNLDGTGATRITNSIGMDGSPRARYAAQRGTVSGATGGSAAPARRTVICCDTSEKRQYAVNQ